MQPEELKPQLQYFYPIKSAETDVTSSKTADSNVILVVMIIFFVATCYRVSKGN